MKPVLRSNLFAMIVIILMGFGSMLIAPIITLLQLPAQYSIVLSEVLFLAVPTIVYFLITKQPVKETLRLNSLSFPSIMIVLLIGLLIYPMSLFIGNLSQLFFHNYLQDAFVEMKSLSLLGFIGTVAVTPAICEELTMRGILFSGYGKIDIKKAALMNGLFFGIMHLNLQQFFYAFIIGVIFTYMVKATNSLFSSMLAHFVCNGVSVVISYFAMKFIQTNGNGEISNITSLPLNVQIISLVVQFFVFAVCIVCIWLLIKLLSDISRKRTINQTVEVNSAAISSAGTVEIVVNERVLNWPFYVTLGVFAVFIALLAIAQRFTNL